MKRVFIPNRGEIALRIVTACHELDLECVVGFAEPSHEPLCRTSLPWLRLVARRTKSGG